MPDERTSNPPLTAAAPAAFDEVWRASVGAIQRQCLSLLNGSHADADDAVSITAMKAFQHYANLRDTVRPTPWLLSIARNVCRDFHRRDKRRRLVEVSLDDEHFSIGIAAAQTEACDEDAHADDARDVLRRSIDLLPRRLQPVARLHLVARMRYGDIARELGMSNANVRKQMQHIRDHLRRGEPAAETTADRARHQREERPIRRLVTLPAIVAGADVDALLVLPVPLAQPAARGVQTLEAYVRKYPTGWRRRLELARALATSGRLAEAEEHYLAVIAKQPYPLEPWLELAQVLRLLGRNGQALATYARGALDTGRDADRHHLHGRAALLRGDPYAASAHLRAAADGNPEMATHHVALAEALLAAGRAAEAQEACEHALACDAHEPLAPALLHDALRAQGRDSEAVERLAAAWTRGAANAAVAERLVLAHLRGVATHPPDVAALLETLRSIAPHHAATAIAAALLEGLDAPMLAFLEQRPHHALMQRALREIHSALERPSPLRP